MSYGWRTGGFGTALLCGVVGAGIVHIVATFATPGLLRPNTYDRITEHLPANTLVVLGQPEADSQLIPYQEPDMQIAVCHYDVSGGPVSARVVLPSSGWTLALYSPAGDNFYVMPGRDQRVTMVNALLMLHQNEDAALPLSAGQTARNAPTYIDVPEPTGLMVIRGPVKGESYKDEVANILARASCGPAPNRLQSSSAG